jgi:hypothetical protein
MSAIAFIVNPVNPKVGVIFTSPVFSAMESPLFILYFRSQAVRTEPINAEARDTSGVFASSKMQRFDVPNHRTGWLLHLCERAGMEVLEIERKGGYEERRQLSKLNIFIIKGLYVNERLLSMRIVHLPSEAAKRQWCAIRPFYLMHRNV